jgi:hypothetical protein
MAPAASGSKWLARSGTKSSRAKILEEAPEHGEGVRGRDKVQNHLQASNLTRTAAVQKVFRRGIGAAWRRVERGNREETDEGAQVFIGRGFRGGGARVCDAGDAIGWLPCVPCWRRTPGQRRKTT